MHDAPDKKYTNFPEYYKNFKNKNSNATVTIYYPRAIDEPKELMLCLFLNGEPTQLFKEKLYTVQLDKLTRVYVS